MIKDYVVGIGLDAVKERLKNEHEVRQLKDRLGEHVERQRKLNFNGTREEELDFGGLTDYIRSDIIEDVQARFFCNKEERAAAHRNIISKSIAYAQSNTKLSRKRAIEMVERAINIVREIFERYGKGETVADIIKDMNARHIKTSLGRDFNENSLHRLLRNKRYIGTYLYKGEETPGGMPRIVSDEVFERVQSILNKTKLPRQEAEARKNIC